MGEGASAADRPKARLPRACSNHNLLFMTAIAAQLEEKLKSLDAQSASSLERLVRDALDLVEIRNGTARSDRLPPDFFAEVARELGSEPFERPAQGESEQRSGW